LRMRYVDFFFMVEKAYHITSSATFHSDLCNKANEKCDMENGKWNLLS
jgi:hypothetical protein